ncbi:MAG TPA: hypothetical protein VFT12_10485 [Thermoanaerobaculia bacterium]|nr:hypothetical protein [Thermoanaerobaculia bacterium]
MRAASLALAVLVFAAVPVFAQGPPKPEAQIAAMAKLDYMAGTWSGEGYFDFGSRRSTFRGSEVVQRKLGGTALLVEGSFFSNIGGNEVPVHTTLGVISYDPQAKTYRFATWLATGTSGQHELQLTAKGWKWELTSPRGTTRYEMTLTEEGDWLEIGERSTNGAEWVKFFEMRLKKQ